MSTSVTRKSLKKAPTRSKSLAMRVISALLCIAFINALLMALVEFISQAFGLQVEVSLYRWEVFGLSLLISVIAVATIVSSVLLAFSFLSFEVAEPAAQDALLEEDDTRTDLEKSVAEEKAEA